MIGSQRERVVSVTVAVLAIIVLVIAKVARELPLPSEPVSDVCLGVCGCGACPPAFYALPIIAVLTILASYVVSVPEEWPSSDGGDES